MPTTDTSNDAMTATKTESYVIRTNRGAQVWAYDDLDLARAYLAKHGERIGCAVHIVKVTKLEEVIE